MLCSTSLLGARDLSLAPPTFVSLIDGKKFPFLVDHLVDGHIILPGTAFLTNSLEGARHAMPEGQMAVVLERFQIRKPVRLGTRDAPLSTIALSTLLLTVGETLEVRLSSPSDTATAKNHSRAQVNYQTALVPLLSRDPAYLSARQLERPIPVDGIYSAMRKKGLDYGPAFSGLSQTRYSKNTASGVVRLHSSVSVTTCTTPHPALLDAGLQLMAGFAVANGTLDDKVEIPYSIERVVWDSALPPSREYRVAVRRYDKTSGQKNVVEFDLELTNEQGQVVLQIIQGRLLAIDASQLSRQD